MTEPSFLRILWESFRKTALPVLAVCSFLLALLKLSGASGPIEVSLYLGAGILALTLLLICTVAEAAYLCRRAGKPLLPPLLTARPIPGETTGLLCLLGPSPLFSVGMAVSFSWIDSNDFEVQVGYGEILVVQEDGKVQAALLSTEPAYKDTLEKLANNDKAILEKIRVRPYVPFYIIGNSARGIEHE